MYRPLDALLVRLAVCPPDRVGLWPDLTGPEAGVLAWRRWLDEVLRVPGFAVAVEQASPVLADRVRAILDGRVTEADARRVVISVLRYLLRATTRSTPFGLFAGIAPARTGAVGTARIGEDHQPIVRLDAQWLTAVIDQLEADPSIRPHLLVRANNLLIERDGELLLENRPSPTPGESPTHVLVRASAPVRAALDLARAPIGARELAEKLAAGFATTPEVTDALIANMIEQRLLLTSLRPLTATSDPLAHVIRAAEAADIGHAGVMTGLHHLHREMTRCSLAREGASAAACRRRLAETAAAVMPPGAPAPIAFDLRLDCDVTVPDTVIRAATGAAHLLARITAPPATGWPSWHRRFLDRYGPTALVPIGDAVDPDLGVGYPAGYTSGSAPGQPALTGRDRTLLALAQHAALTGRRTITLDEATITELSGSDPNGPQPSFELTVCVDAPSMRAIEAGEYELTVTAVSRAAGTVTGRFLDMLEFDDLDRMTAAYATIPTVTRGALRVQLSAATPHLNTANVARAPRLLPLLVLGEYHDEQPDTIPLSDIAVTATSRSLHLVSLSRRQVVEPVTFNAVNLVGFSLPLVRFLVESPTALHAGCTAFDWGAAAGLPFLPSVRYGRTVLSPAQWRLAATDLPGPDALWAEFRRALTDWQESTGCPRRVYLGHSDQRIGLDLDESAHHALLRDYLRRNPHAVLGAAPDAEANSWIGGHHHEIVIPMASTAEPVSAPRLPDHTVRVRDHGHLPGHGDRLYLKVYARPDQQTAILTRHLPTLRDQLDSGASCWFLRYADPEPHLRLRVTGITLAMAAEWTAGLRQTGLTARVQIDTYFPETARFGGPAALPAAEAYFTVDSAAAVAQLTATTGQPTAVVTALTAASLFDLTIALLGNPDQAAEWLISNTRAHQPGPSRTLYRKALAWADPTRLDRLAALPHGPRLLDTWAQRRDALTCYRDQLHATGSTATDLMPDLIHLHHTRVAGPDLNGERACLHLARAAALAWTARASRQHPS